MVKGRSRLGTSRLGTSRLGPSRLGTSLRAAVLMSSLALTGWAAVQITRDPLLRPVVDRSADQIVAATDRMLARGATPQVLTTRIEARLAEDPRNWIALRALQDLAAERGIPLPAATQTAIDTAWQDEQGLLAGAADCARCAYDPGTCTLSNVLICQVPVALTPVGDLAGITRAGVAYATGSAVDQVDLALSVVGLGATAVVVASGGSSAMVKAGAGMARLARRMNLLSPRLMALAGDTVRTGVIWADLPAARSADDLARAIRTEAFAPLTAIAGDVARLRGATDVTTTLHLLPLIDDAADARRLARAAEALGPRITARAEVLGKTRLLRATVRVGDVALALVAGMAVALAALAGMIGGVLQALLLRLVRIGLRG